MAVMTFAAIDIGSYNVSIEIFEMSKKNGLKSLNRVRTGLELGADTFALGRISIKRLEELTKILIGYQEIMKEYGVTTYRVCAKSAIREAKNRYLVLDHIYRATGIKIDVLSNSVQRFLGYKSIASRGEDFKKVIEKGTAIVDVGGGSIQISLFDKDTLVSTQNLEIGSLKIRERLAAYERDSIHYDQLVGELIHKDISNFKRMYLKNRTIDHIILVGDYFTNLIFQNTNDQNKFESKEEFLNWYHAIIEKSPKQIAEELHIGSEMATVLIPTAVVYKTLIEEMDAKMIWLPGIQLTDGIAYDYGEKQRIIKSNHDFDRDILNAAKNIAKRYAGNKPHNEKLLEIASRVFDVLKKESKMTPREKLLLKVACYLHDCGKYISLTNVAACSYHIISSTEIIGLSESERRIIANVVRYNTEELADYNEIASEQAMGLSDYLIVARLTAIMRLSNSLDQSYTQKAEAFTISKKDGMMIVTITSKVSFLLEAGMFRETTDFFEEIFDVKPILKLKGVR